MKNYLIALCLLFSIQLASGSNVDSLLTLIASDPPADSVLEHAYSDLLSSIIEADIQTFLDIANAGIEKAKERNNRLIELVILNKIGEAYYLKDNYQQAHFYWIESLKIAETLNIPYNLSTALTNLVGLYMATKEYDKAFEYNSRAIEVAKANNDSITLMVYQFHRIQLLLALTRYPEAAEILKEISPDVEKFNNPYRRVASYSTIGNLYGKMATTLMEGSERTDYLNRSLENYFQGLKESEELGVENYIASFKLNIGDTYLWLNNEERGFKYLNEAIALAKKNNNLKRLKSAHTVYERYYYRVEQFKNAYFHLDTISMLKDSILDFDSKSKILDLQEKYETEKKDLENKRLTEQNEKQQLLNNIYLIFSIITLLLLSIVSILLLNIRKKKTELEQSKKELEELNSNLIISKEETEKALEFKSLFLANMSHEIRTPLNIIIGFNSILNKNVTDPKLKKYIQSIETGSYNLLRFLNDILDMSKIEAGKIVLNSEIINLPHLIYDLKELFSLKAEEKKLQLHVDFDNNVPEGILFDEVRLRQIMVNLLGNAIKFTHEGYIHIKVSAPGVNKYQNELATKTTLQISISDTGIGISPEDQKQIFESFRQVNLNERKDIGGTGLGLAISKRLTEILGGTIAVESEKGKGSTFTITFKNVPIAFFSDETGTQKHLPEKANEFIFDDATLIIADDEEMNRNLITVCFENSKVKVLEAANGNEAVSLAQNNKPNLILMDLKMPFRDGIEAGRILKCDIATKEIPIIAFSASNVFDNLSDEERILFAGLLSKPLIVDELFEKIAPFLPHKIIPQKPKSPKPEQAFQFSFRNDLNIVSQEINARLRDDFYRQWKSIYQTNSMKKIIDFAAGLKTFSIQQKLNGMESYAQAVIDAANGFDVEDVKKLLRQFPDILHLFKT